MRKTNFIQTEKYDYLNGFVSMTSEMWMSLGMCIGTSNLLIGGGSLNIACSKESFVIHLRTRELFYVPAGLPCPDIVSSIF